MHEMPFFSSGLPSPYKQTMSHRKGSSRWGLLNLTRRLLFHTWALGKADCYERYGV